MSAMRRRELMILICGAAASIVSPVPLSAQQTGKVYRIGFLSTGSGLAPGPGHEVLEPSL
jgi:hypothetical protein